MNITSTIRILGLAFLICLGLVSCKPAETSKPEPEAPSGGQWHFDGVAEVRAFQMNWEVEHSYDRILSDDGKLNESRAPIEGIALSHSQIEKLRAAVTGSHPEHPTTECFYPHHAFLFYDKEGAIIGHIDVCFKCSKFEGSPKGFSEYGDLAALEALVIEIGMPIRNDNWGK